MIANPLERTLPKPSVVSAQNSGALPPTAVASVVSDIHPVDYIQTTQHSCNAATENKMLQLQYGWALPATLAAERQISLAHRRLGGLPSSNLLYESLTGGLDEIRPSDIYREQPGTQLDEVFPSPSDIAEAQFNNRPFAVGWERY